MEHFTQNSYLNMILVYLMGFILPFLFTLNLEPLFLANKKHSRRFTLQYFITSFYKIFKILIKHIL